MPVSQPAAKPVSPAGPREPTTAASDRGRVLVVDDDPIFVMVLQSWLALHGYAVTAASRPEEAEEAIRQGGFDLVISDIQMPGNYRLQWTEALLARNDANTVLLMTGSPELETACRAANLPVAGYLIKPPDWTTLDARLQQMISRRRCRQGLQTLVREIRADGSFDLGAVEKDAFCQRLVQLDDSLSAESRTAVSGPNASLQAAIVETIAVLEQTKHSFRSKALGDLRQRLRKLLSASAAS